MDKQRCCRIDLSDPHEKPLVLVVDSNLDNLGLTSEVLKDCNCSLIFAWDGLQALRITEQYQPDLILTEIMLPKIDGIDAIKRLRQQGNQTPIIVLTSLVTPKIAEQAELAGCDEFISKPYEVNELESTVFRYLRRQFCPFSLSG